MYIYYIGYDSADEAGLKIMRGTRELFQGSLEAAYSLSGIGNLAGGIVAISYSVVGTILNIDSIVVLWDELLGARSIAVPAGGGLYIDESGLTTRPEEGAIPVLTFDGTDVTLCLPRICPMAMLEDSGEAQFDYTGLQTIPTNILLVIPGFVTLNVTQGAANLVPALQMPTSITVDVTEAPCSLTWRVTGLGMPPQLTEWIETF